MYSGATVALLIPARDEEEALPAVLDAIPDWIDEIVVVDNGSTDHTALAAQRYGATVIREPNRGYGRACLAGLEWMKGRSPDVVVFADADGSDDLGALAELVAMVTTRRADLALAYRIPRDRGAMTIPQRFGNRLATWLIRRFWGQAYRDLGPMRAISWSALRRLEMDDRGFGWTVQMQIRAITRGLRVEEVGASYRPRTAGRSKISGTVRGTVQAGATILAIIAREAVRGRPLGRDRAPAPQTSR
jgi:glycosyltransferase involved in cell wall biosynthesis